MKVCVAGLGAVGGLVAARLALAGHEVSALARGATLAAVRERGLVLTSSQGERRVARIAAADAAVEPAATPELLIVDLQGPGLAADAQATRAADRPADDRAADDERRAVVVLAARRRRAAGQRRPARPHRGDGAVGADARRGGAPDLRRHGAG